MTGPFNNFSNDLLYVFLTYFNNRDFVKLTMVCKDLHSRMVSCLARSKRLKPLADSFFTTILRNQPRLDVKQRKEDWAYFTFKGRQFPSVNVPPYTVLNYSRYASYSELKYTEYYVRSLAICNLITRRKDTDFSGVSVRLEAQLDDIKDSIRESASFLLFPCWVNGMICEDETFFKSQTTAACENKFLDELSENFRLQCERNLSHLIEEEAMPRNDVRRILKLHKLS